MWFEHGTSRIFYEDQGSGTPVLLLPGWSESFEDLSDIRDYLLSAGYRVVAADLPGSGRSLPFPREYTASYFEEDAASFAALLEHLSLGATHLIGFSDGGETALVMSVLTPGVARSVITWGSAGSLNDPSGQMRAVMSNLIDNPIPPMQGYRDYLVAQYGEDNARTMTQNFARGLSDIVDTRNSDISLSRADRITCPVLLIAGEHDMFAPRPLLSQLAARINNVEMHIVEGAGHSVNADEPEWLKQTILDWLAKH
jgi:valacyclovir hydrolase